ncbi:UbiA family prenyltransferase [Kitasatospora camelliae]|uniref:UbiA family prenyltransferase n=1 Tax=Kitasatospora camelliae TaxID=3156397 RepID=A0AAU8JRJ5_9ACTN
MSSEIAVPRPWSRAGRLLRACHPAPAAAVTVFAAALAASAGRGGAGTALTLAAVGAGQLSIGWHNDRLDAGRDRAAGRRDKPLATGDLAPGTVGAAAGWALAACVPLSLAAGWPAGLAHLTGVAAGWAYNLRLKRTLLSWLPYALAFGLLPAFVTLGLPGAPWPRPWVLAAAALLGTGAHLANVLPDIEDDLASGIRGLPQRLGRTRSGPLAALLVLAASAVLLLGPSSPAGPVAGAALTVATALTAAALAAPRTRLPFLATLAAAAIDVTVLVAHGTALT